MKTHTLSSHPSLTHLTLSLLVLANSAQQNWQTSRPSTGSYTSTLDDPPAKSSQTQNPTNCVLQCFGAAKIPPYCAANGIVFDNACAVACFADNTAKLYDCPQQYPVYHCAHQCRANIYNKCKYEKATPSNNIAICVNNGFLYDNLAQAQCDVDKPALVFSCSKSDGVCARRCRNALVRDSGPCASLTTVSSQQLVCGIDGNWYYGAEQANCVGVALNALVTCSASVAKSNCQSVCMGRYAVTRGS